MGIRTQLYIEIEKNENKEKEAGKGPFFKKGRQANTKAIHHQWGSELKFLPKEVHRCLKMK